MKKESYKKVCDDCHWKINVKGTFKEIDDKFQVICNPCLAERNDNDLIFKVRIKDALTALHKKDWKAL